jgi:hypothetical protein
VADKAQELIELAAAGMAMKPNREVQEVVELEDGYAARTHDGRWSFLDADFTFVELAPVGYSPVSVKKAAPAAKKG